VLKRIAITAAACVVAFSFGACTKTLRLELPPDTPIELKRFIEVGVEAQPHTKSFQPSSSEYQRLQEWLAHNQRGWAQSLATNPISGVFVTAGDVRLQFTGGIAFAFTDHGQYQKKVRHVEYAFLEAAVGI
jgi:hypothetical protein